MAVVYRSDRLIDGFIKKKKKKIEYPVREQKRFDGHVYKLRTRQYTDATVVSVTLCVNDRRTTSKRSVFVVFFSLFFFCFFYDRRMVRFIHAKVNQYLSLMFCAHRVVWPDLRGNGERIENILS